MNRVFTSLDDIDAVYQVIYADPPWRYNFSRSKSRKIENQYPTMKLDEIKNLNVPSSDNSILFLWSTAPKLPEALEVMKAWGFEYQTCIVWDKVRMGMGYWVRGQHENLLVGIKGNFLIPDKINFLPVISIKRGCHSKKPDFFRTLISDLFPDLNKIELFARHHFEGWDVFGNEINSSIQKMLLQKEAAYV